MSKTPKREIIKQAILEGGATKESLMDAAEVNADGFASQCSYLRLTGFYPIVLEDGTYDHTDEAGWDALKAAKVANRKPAAAKKTPYERLEAAKKRVVRTEKAAEAAKVRFEKSDDANEHELNLRSQKASIEAELADIELEKAQDLYDNTPEGERGVPETGEDTEGGNNAPAEDTEPVEASDDELL